MRHPPCWSPDPDAGAARVPARGRPVLPATLILAALTLAPASPAFADQAAPPSLTSQADLDAAFRGFFEGGLDLDRPLAVRGLVIKRDSMELTLTDGVVYLAQPVAGRVPGAYFSGTGAIRVTVPNPIDRKLLGEGYGRTVFEEVIGEAALRFNDGTEREIAAAGRPGATAAGDPAAAWSDRQKIDFNSTSRQMDFLENAANGFQWAGFFTVDVRVKAGNDWYGFSRNGGARIENALYRERAMGSAGKRWYETLSMFHRPEDYDARGNYDLMPAGDAKDTAALRHVEMDIEIPNTKSVIIDARVTIESLRDGLRAVRFSLLNNLGGAWYEKGRTVTVEGVAGPSGDSLPYVHGCNELLVLLPRPLTRGEKSVIRVKATENTIIELTDKSYWIYTDSAWFPKIGAWGGRYTFDWTFRVARPMRAASSGDVVREWTEGSMNCGRYTSDVPARMPSFIFGDLKPTEGSYRRDEAAGEAVAMRLFTVLGGGSHFKGKPENVLYNIEQGLKTYESAFGPFPFRELDIAEMAPQVSFAQSPAGILLLPSGIAGTSGGGGATDQLIFHELAHQWWGHNVGSVGLEDDWISESWAEYSAGLITEAIDRKKFRLMRDDWKKKALETDKFGTIATAYRSNSIEYPWARTNLLYSKGPCVVHMLRTWMGWDKYSRYVNTIQTKYRGAEINTDTLAREASTVMGYDMFPFFDQWVRDKGIPKVFYSWSVTPESDGRKLVTIRVRQEDEANFKILMVPISLDFGKGEPTVIQKPILSAKAEIQLRVPIEPRSLALDEDASQLAIFVPEAARR